MKKYKAGDKIVLEITGINELGSYIFGDITYSWLVSSGFFDKFSKPLSEYTEKLEKKNENKQRRIEKLVERLHRQADEITRLLAENAELKGLNSTICDVCKHDEFLKETREVARAEGQQEAWELAQKIVKSKICGGFDMKELQEIFGTKYYGEAITQNTYPEAAANVAEWERQKEICVGDIVMFNGKCGLVTNTGKYLKGISENGIGFCWIKDDCKKTGRHIDTGWLAQIGGDQNDNR